MFLIRRALADADLEADLHVVKDGEQAIRFFDQADSDTALDIPDLVLLDINLPKRHGGEVLQQIRRSRRCGNALVIATSTSDSPKDRDDMRRLGANRYFHKPSEHEEFMKLGNIVKELLGRWPFSPGLAENGQCGTSEQSIPRSRWNKP